MANLGADFLRIHINFCIVTVIGAYIYVGKKFLQSFLSE